MMLEEGTETELEHTSRLYLWAANWIIADSGGYLDFREAPSRN